MKRIATSPMSDHDPNVAVIIPIWNENPEHFQSCIESIKSQTYSGEIIASIHNDGSKSRLSEEYRKILNNKNLNFRYRQSQNNNGVSHARNRAIKNCNSELLIPLDADDVLHPKAIEIVVDRFRKLQNIELVYSDNIKFNSPDLCLHQYRKKHIYHQFMLYYKNTIYDPLLQSSFIVGLQAYTRDIFDTINGYDETIRSGEDIKLLLDIHKQSSDVNFFHVPFVLYYRRHSPNSLSRDNQSSMHKTTERLFLKYLKENVGNITNVEYHQRIPPYHVSHYTIKKEDGSSVTPPYIDKSQNVIRDVWDEKSLYRDWMIYHREILEGLLS